MFVSAVTIGNSGGCFRVNIAAPRITEQVLMKYTTMRRIKGKFRRIYGYVPL